MQPKGLPAAGVSMKAELRARLIPLAILIGAVAVLGFGLDWFFRGRFIETTDDAYVKSDIAAIAARVNGYVASIHTAENQWVRAGDVILRLDDADFAARVRQAEAALDARRAILASVTARVELEGALIDSARAKVESATADARRAASDLARYADLRDQGATSAQRYEQALAENRKAEAALDAATASLKAEEDQLAIIETQRVQAEAEIAQAQATLDLARLDLAHTTIRAPMDGVIANRSAEPGQYVRAGTTLIAIVPLPQVYVIANFKETQVAEMRRGQRVEIEIDAFPGEVLTGRVVSFAPATGSEFSLLPPENATGNFTKIVQRVPVRIEIDGAPELMPLLRPGLSVTVGVDTADEGDGPDARLAAAPRPQGPLAGDGTQPVTP